MEKKNSKIIRGKILSVRKIIALAVTAVFCYLSLTKSVSSSEFIPIFTMIIGYYFGKSTALDIPTNVKENDIN
ncbi:MAG: hypothetical protein ACRDA5_01845 [Clostridium sp.]